MARTAWASLLLAWLLHSQPLGSGYRVFSEGEPPEFDLHLPSSISVQEGGTAYLHCRIFHADNMSVSWIRGADSHIITVDQETFISDQRFSSLIKNKDNLWTLKIKHVSAMDAGKYECQVSTVPKMSREVELVVVVPKVRIFGGPDIYVREFSSLQLECVISATIVSPRFVVWEHNGKLVPGTSVIKVQDSPSTSSSTLSMDGVTRYQAGNYSCHPDNLHPATVALHVLSKDGEHLPVTGSAQHTTELLLHYLILNLLSVFLP